MREIEATWGHAVKIWWALLWRGIVFSLLGSIPVGLLLAAIVGILVIPYQQYIVMSLVSGVITGVFIAIWVILKVLKKEFSTFRIALIKV